MQKLVKAYVPFLIYFLCAILAYFIAFYLLPKYNVPLAFLGLLVIYLYIYLFVFFIGFFMGRATVKRLGIHNFILYFIYAIISLFMMLFIGSLKDVFSHLYCKFPITLSFFFDALFDIDSLVVSVGTFVSFLVGEIIEHFHANK
ncbi:hypothetical protein C8E03_10398 [Lachnotalea glycerini]|uniref:Uncharacterized protein n=1 Tax=Lachnotalea glycerini TaxID=1763509 RepID=A0A318ET25_9FIRM|nr:hypothetical protein [Lachnotalea glycerini]PXV91541.1 hypothetical protein C8E03_10398 [Lachnotalea glycerini]